MSSEDTRRAEEDLAYLRGLVQDGGEAQRAAGKLFVAAGLIYGPQIFGHWLQAIGVLQADGLAGLAVAIVPTVVFLAYMFRMMSRKDAKPRGSTAKSFDAAFAALGMTNGVLIAIFAPAAIMRQSLEIWLFYPAVVFALQGAGWLIAWMLRKRAWMGVAALGWFASAIALGALIGSPNYPLMAGIAFVILMVGPGLALMRTPA